MHISWYNKEEMKMKEKEEAEVEGKLKKRR